MCGRYLQLSSGEAMARWFGFEGGPAWPERYNIAPSQNVPVVRLAEDGGKRECVLMRWGLVPSWAREASFNASTINARAETLAVKPAFREAFRRRRCLVPADGFYEWKATGQKHKQPYVIQPVDGKPLAFAGLWDRWRGPQGDTLESMTIVTTEANELLRPLHERMPVILSPEHYAVWLDPHFQKTDVLKRLLGPCPDGWLSLTAVTPYVSNARHEGPRCLEPQTQLFA
jgi:putative SOS response-associated peptidase YedK